MNPPSKNTGKRQQKVSFNTQKIINPIPMTTQKTNRKNRKIRKNLKHPIYLNNTPEVCVFS